MQVADGLKATGIRIEAITLQAVFLREMARHQENVGQVGLILRRDLARVSDILLGNEHVVDSVPGIRNR